MADKLNGNKNYGSPAARAYEKAVENSESIQNLTAQLDDAVNGLNEEWSNWTPVFTWVSGTPTGVSAIARYKVIGKTVFVRVRMTATDSDGITSVSVSLPISPKNLNLESYIPTYRIKGVTGSVYYGFLRDDGVNDDLFFATSSTAGESLELKFDFMYEGN